MVRAPRPRSWAHALGVPVVSPKIGGGAVFFFATSYPLLPLTSGQHAPNIANALDSRRGGGADDQSNRLAL
jgi:hypothetical protein